MRLLLAAACALLAGLLAAVPAARAAPAALPYPPATLPHGALEVVHEFRGAMPTGVAVSRGGRVFVNHPRWGDRVEFTVGELRGGREVPYPSAAMNDPRSPDHLLSVQSVVVGPDDRLWALDTGTENMGPIRGQAWPKLVAIDLGSNQVVRVVRFPPEVVRAKSYLNDVRFDLRRGREGVAFITDSGQAGIIVVDLASGRSWRKLDGDPATSPDPAFDAVADGQPLAVQPAPDARPKPFRVASDGIALDAGGARLFFCPLASRQLWSVSADALADEQSAPEAVRATLHAEQRAFPSDGLEADARGRLYLTDWEHDAVVVRTGENTFQTLVQDPRLLWPDTLALADGGWLYVTANQLHRQPRFHAGQDLRKKPYLLLRVKVEGATPVRLGR